MYYKSAKKSTSPNGINNASYVKTQSDGAKVYVKAITEDKFDVVIDGRGGVVTGLRHLSKKAIERLAKNYGWR